MKRFLCTSVLVLLAACTTDHVETLPTPAAPSDVVMIKTYPLPEGPVPPSFVEDPKRGAYEIDIKYVRDALPDLLPGESKQDCGPGAGLMLKLSDGHTLTYGTCAYPKRFAELAAAIDVAWKEHWPKRSST
jgi:hypothetical protein